MSASSPGLARPRGILRSIGAVFVGLVAIFVLSLATDQLFHALGVIGTILSILGAIAMWDFGPNWYPVLLAASALPSAWLGGLLYRSLHRADALAT